MSTTNEEIIEAYWRLSEDKVAAPGEPVAAPVVTPPAAEEVAGFFADAGSAPEVATIAAVAPEAEAVPAPSVLVPAAPAPELVAPVASELRVTPTLLGGPGQPLATPGGPGGPRRPALSSFVSPAPEEAPTPFIAAPTPLSAAPTHHRRGLLRAGATKKWFIAALVLGVLAYSGAGGSFSSFNAQTNNVGSSVASGTLALSDQVNSGTACLSSGGSLGSPVNNINTGCSAILSLSNLEPGTWASTQTATVTIKNTGSLPAAFLYLWAPSSSDCTDTQTTSSSNGGLYGTQLNYNPTTGNPFCAAVLMYIQETATVGSNTDYYCWIGGNSATGGASEASTSGLCDAPISGITLTTGLTNGQTGVTSLAVAALNGPVYSGDSVVVTNGTNSQTFTASATAAPGATSISVTSATANAAYAAGSSVSDSTTASALNSDTTHTIHNFDTSHAGNAGELELYPINGAGTVSTSATTALAANSNRTFTVGLYLPNPTGTSQNGLQGLQSTFGIDWYLSQ